MPDRTLAQALRLGLSELSNAHRLLVRGSAVRWHAGLLARAPRILATRSLGPADAFLGTRLRIRIDEREIALAGTDFGVCREIIGGDCYGFRSQAPGARQIVDLGANAGVFSLFAACLCPGCHVTAVEANPALLDAARRNLQEAGFEDRVELMNAIVGDPDRPELAALKARGASGFDPDSLLNQIGECDFLKCDVEGSEHSLFSGDLGWLERVRAMGIEYHWSHDDGRRLASVIEAEGFVVRIIPRPRLGYLLCHR
jgi:hypothetical protein